MSQYNCAICSSQTAGIFSLEIPCEHDGEAFTRYVCGKCWEIIFAIAKKAAIAVTEEELTKAFIERR